MIKPDQRSGMYAVRFALIEALLDTREQLTGKYLSELLGCHEGQGQRLMRTYNEHQWDKALVFNHSRRYRGWSKHPHHYERIALMKGAKAQDFLDVYEVLMGIEID